MLIENRIQRETEMAAKVPAAPATFKEMPEMLRLPDSLQGKKILDIGAGASDRSYYYALRGIQVTAFDLGYSFPEYMINVARQQLTPMHPASYFEAMRRFERDYLVPNREGTYVTGTVTQMPFKDDSFDFAYSTQCLSAFVRDPELFITAIKEGIRVIKPGGKLQVSPVYDDELIEDTVKAGFPWTPNHSDTIRALKDAGLEFSEIRLDPRYRASLIEFTK